MLKFFIKNDEIYLYIYKVFSSKLMKYICKNAKIFHQNDEKYVQYCYYYIYGGADNQMSALFI